MVDDTLSRRLFKEQIIRELIEEIRKYQVGWASNGRIIATKNSKWDGYIFVIPDAQYMELFREKNNTT